MTTIETTPPEVLWLDDLKIDIVVRYFVIPPEWQKYAQTALDVMDASNSCGVAQTLVAVMKVLSQWDNPVGTEMVNQHPIVLMFLDKLLQLARVDHLGDAGWAAMETCQKIAAGETPLDIKINTTSRSHWQRTLAGKPYHEDRDNG